MAAETPRNESLAAPLNEVQLRLISVIQRIVYRCIQMSVDDAGEKVPEKFPTIIDLLNTWLQRFVDTGEIHKSQIIFDETIWPPNQPERHGTVLRVFLAPTPAADYYILEIDLTKGYHDCASLLAPEYGSTPIDPFNVNFEANLN